MTCGENKPVTIGPVGDGGVGPKMTVEENCRDIGHAHGHARMTGRSFFYGVDCQNTKSCRHSKVAIILVRTSPASEF